MIEIPLTKGYIALIDDCDIDLSTFKWTAWTGKKCQSVYAYRKNTIVGRPKNIRLHCFIMERILGRQLLYPGEEVDHWDGNPLNNCRSNLRLSSHQQNSRNRKLAANNTSGFKGVYFHKRASKYVAQIRIDGKLTHLGLFTSPEAAAHAYNEAALKHFGEFARLNEIPQTTNE